MNRLKKKVLTGCTLKMQQSIAETGEHWAANDNSSYKAHHQLSKLTESVTDKQTLVEIRSRYTIHNLCTASFKCFRSGSATLPYLLRDARGAGVSPSTSATGLHSTCNRRTRNWYLHWSFFHEIATSFAKNTNLLGKPITTHTPLTESS